ncbi:hypothetical protein GGR21_000536 [Dysgonomonas hofstadii]|uniref:Uncharacterized protein n=1 Tax=Dysgonomonas hofstadii TaxID=637886 RepID=A0A840CJ03_9BACT|nr:hypothetical protein [Dysgonomonas hofstadii]MBB4034649.1 hypothetical protein [Dysgonomonas hofstadii]
MDFNFSFGDIFRYWNTLTDYINPVWIIAWAIIGGLIGFFLFLVLELVLRKKILVNRRHWSLKYLSYIYMAFFLLFGAFCFTQWFAIHNCQTQLVNNIPAYLGSANAAFNEYLKDEIEAVVEARYLDLTGREALTKTADVAAKTLSDYIKSTETDIGSKVSAMLIQTDFIKEKVVSQLAEKVGEQLLMDKDLTQEMLDVKINNILNDGVLNSVVEKHIRNIFGGLKMQIYLIFLIGLLIPVAEIILAHYLEKKQLKEESDVLQLPLPEQDSV